MQIGKIALLTLFPWSTVPLVPDPWGSSRECSSWSQIPEGMNTEMLIMVRLVQCKLAAESLFSGICFLWNCALGSVGLSPERRGNCLWHTGQPSVLRFDSKQLTMPSTQGWGDETSSGEDVVPSNPCGARVPRFRNCPCCAQPMSSPGVNGRHEQIGVAGASGLGGDSLSEWFPMARPAAEEVWAAPAGTRGGEGQCVATCLCSFLPMGAAFSSGWQPLWRGKPEEGSGLFTTK